MNNEKVGGYISKIHLNDGTDVDIQQNDIIIFVGPNNAGKSQSLKDIYMLASEKQPTTVVTDITTQKYPSHIKDLLDNIAQKEVHGSTTSYNVLGHTFYYNNSTDDLFQSDSYFGMYLNLFVVNLDTAARLTICDAASSITRSSPKHHPIHYAAFEQKYRMVLSDNFKKAFGIEITPNTQNGATVPLCIGPLVKLDKEYNDEQSRQEDYAKILETYKQVQNQGDGIKSFTGILLYLMLDYFCTFLIDEPESFLHPPQARIMGQIIGHTLSDQQQCFISTHSEEIIKGLLEVSPERIKIIRITRKEDTNYFSILNNDKFKDVWGDPLLKYSNIMSSLFHKSVVLCESDSDCKMYSVIESHLKQSTGKYSETLFIHCGGKHRMARIASALRALNIDIKLIADIDVLNDEQIFKGIVEAFGIEWTSVQNDYNKIVGNLHSPKEKINRNEAKTTINRIIDNSQAQDLSPKEIKEIRNVIRTISKWDSIKSGGVNSIPSGDATFAFSNLNNILQENGIYIVPVGELECFIKSIGSHGPEWTNIVLETYPDINNPVYNQIRDFINNMNL
jgi:hypothetical protein